MSGSAAAKQMENARREGGRMMRFGGVGVANTALDLVIYAVLLALGLAPVAANVIGFLGANAQSYFLNARFTFREGGRSSPITLAGYGKFAAAHIVSLIISTLMIIALADSIGAFAAKIAALGFTFVWNYSTTALFVFKRRGGEDGRTP